MTVQERWRHHKMRAAAGECKGHPFYDELRLNDPALFRVEVLHRVKDREAAMALEELEISRTPADLSANLSCGGVNDAAEGGRIFWERLNANPGEKEAFLKRLSERKLADDWTDYPALAAAARQWRKEHPREAYRIAYRAIRISNRKAGRAAPCEITVDERPLKERLLHKYKLNEIRSRNTTAVWANRSDTERKEIGFKISQSTQKRMDAMDIEEKREMTAKARNSIDRETQGKAASAGLKGWWADLKADPERYADYMERRTASLKKKLNAKEAAS